MQFKSAVDKFLLVFIIAALVFAIFAVIYSFAEMDTLARIISMIVVLVSIALPVWILVSTRYEINEDMLLIRSGPVSLNIPLSQIHSVEPTRSLLAAPALSLQRLRIRYGENKQVLVSPENPEAFIEALGIQEK